MITGAFIYLFAALINFALAALPVIPFPVILDTAIITFFSYLNTFAIVVPVDTVLQALFFVISFEIAFFAFDIIIWFVHLIRGK